MPSAASARRAPPALPGRRSRHAAKLVVTGVLVLLAVGYVGSRAAVPAGASSLAGSIALTSETSWVRNASDLSLGVAVHTNLPAADLALNLTLFSQITSRTEFDVTVAGGVDGLATESVAEIPLAPLAGPVRAGTTPMQLGLLAPGVPGSLPAHFPSDQVLQLSCQPGACDGVYPLRVSLVDSTTSKALDTFTTHVIVATSSSYNKPLDFSLVVPVGAQLSISPAGAASPTRSTIAALATVASTAGPGGMPVTVAPYGQTLEALHQRASPADRSLLSAISSIGAPDSPSELLSTPYTLVDPTALTASGLGGDIAPQLERGRVAMHDALGTEGSGGVFVATSPLSGSGLSALAGAGTTEVVVPETNLVPSGWTYTETAPFVFKGTKVEGIQSDSGLLSHLTAGGDPVLRAHQLLADLAVLYYSWQLFSANRGVVLAAPADWTPNATFLSTLAGGLASSPIISAVTLSTLFKSSPVENACVNEQIELGCSPATRALSPPGTGAGAGATSDTLRGSPVLGARASLNDLASVVPTETALLSHMSDTVLLSETAGIPVATRLSYASAPGAALAALSAEISLPSGRTVTVTSSHARIPIVVSSSSAFPLHLVMELSSPSISLRPSEQSQVVLLSRGNNIKLIDLSTPTSGQFPLQVELVSPTGRVIVGSARFVIRSTAISGVAIALTAGAAAFLAIWWVRSGLRRRRSRQGGPRHAKGTRDPAPAEPVSASTP